MTDLLCTSFPDWEERLILFHSGDLPLEERETFTEHLASCAACTALLAEYQGIDDLVRRSFTPKRPLELPQDFAQAMESQTEERQCVDPGNCNQSIDVVQEAALIVEETQRQWKKSVITTMRHLETSSWYPSVSVVIRILHEKQTRHLSDLLRSVPAVVTEIIVVGRFLPQEVDSLLQQLPSNVRIIVQTGSGKTNALREGFDACTGDIIVTLDANGTTHPGEIPRFVDKLMEGYHFAKGSRFIEGGTTNDTRLIHRLGSYLLSRFVRLLFAVPLRDACYGYTALWKDCLNDLELECDYLGTGLEALLFLRKFDCDLRIVEVPSVEHPSLDGESKWSFRYVWDMLQVLVRTRVAGKISDTHQGMYVEILPNWI